MISGKTIFISPLDWGLGHATRCVPIINELSKNNTVLIGVSSLNELFFSQQFPDLKKIHVPSYAIRYSNYLPVWLKILVQWPKIKSIIRAEKKVLEKLIATYSIDLIISDNRFGLHHPSVESIFITHQLNIRAPFFSSFANKENRTLIHQFNQVWVPDYENKNQRLSGQLSDSKGYTLPVKYIGPQSALQILGSTTESTKKNDYLILLSGVEPQRSILEKELLSKFKNSDKKIVLVRGSDSPTEIQNKKIETHAFAFGEKLKALICSSETIICRSGYSTLMDLHLLNKKKLVLIPTPGQTEQEYLAKYWEQTFGAEVYQQGSIKTFS